jgi:hypothetical protein
MLIEVDRKPLETASTTTKARRRLSLPPHFACQSTSKPTSSLAFWPRAFAEGAASTSDQKYFSEGALPTPNKIFQ